MDVQLPDGRVLKGVPDGTTKSQLAAKLKANGIDLSAAPKKDDLPQPEDQTMGGSFSRFEGENLEGAGEDLKGAVSPFKRDSSAGPDWLQKIGQYPGGVISGVGGAVSSPFTSTVQAAVETLANKIYQYGKPKDAGPVPQEELEKEHRIAGAVGGAGSNVLMALGTKPLATAAGKTAGMAGETIGRGAKGAREFINRKSDEMAKQATLDALPTPAGLLKGAGGKPLQISPKNLEGARSILQTALKEDDINPLDVAQRLEEAKASGLPVTAADVITKEMGGVVTQGKNTIGLLKGAANMPGPGASMAGEVAARGMATSKRIGGTLDRFLSRKGVYDISDAALEKMRTETPKVYAKAFEGGSIAPLEKQLEGEFHETAAAKAAAKAKIDQINARLTFIEGKKQTNANIYVDNSLIRAKRQAHEELAAAQKQWDAANAREQSALDMLKQAQADRKNGVKGAVWSPRIGEMLSDDTIQRGIKKGLWIAKKEALANGEKFNPSEYGITGYDEAGDPIVSKVPNMRMLDAGKKGLDAIINESKNPLTGKMNETGRAVSMLKNSYLKEIDALNPDYKLAREQYADQASILEALKEGRDFMSMDKEEISRFMKNPETTNAEKGAFAAGVRRTLQERLDAASDNSNPINSIWKQGMRDRLEAVFPDEQSFKQFSSLMEQEQSMARVNNALATGSHTNMLGNYQGILKTPGKVLKAVTNPQGAAVDFGMEQMSKVLQKQAANMSKEQAAAVSRYLTTDDPEVWYDLARRTRQ